MNSNNDRVVNRTVSRTVNLFYGPPSSVNQDKYAMKLFFESLGLHIVCGGTTAQIAANFLGNDLKIDLCYEDKDIPPLGHIDGIDVVTEGIITLTHVVENAKIEDRNSRLHDASNIVSNLLFDYANIVNLFVGLAQNPFNISQGIDSDYKVELVKQLVLILEKKGKKVSVRYF